MTDGSVGGQPLNSHVALVCRLAWPALLSAATVASLALAACNDNEEAAPAPAGTTARAEVLPTSTPASVPTDGTLAFTSCVAVDDEGQLSCDIYVVKADGSGLTRVVAGGFWPVWSPDGSRFVFLGEDEQVSVVNADGSGLVRLAESGDPISPPAWSPDGERIVFVRGQDTLAVVAADGSGGPTFFENPEFDYYFTPAWSPDGRRIVFQFFTQAPFGLGTQLYLIDPDGSGLTQLTDMDPDPFFPTWSPDSSRITFAAEGDIYVVNVDGTGLTNLTSFSQGNYPVWSPDGSRIAFASCGDVCALSVVNADGSGQANITGITAVRTRPAWSPDSAAIAFLSCGEVYGETSTCAVYVVNADGSGLARIAEAPANEELLTVSWSPAQ